jgi:putative modified peptide
MTQPTYTPEAIDQLLDKLSSDDEFREHFLGNPALALHTVGVHVDPAQVPAVRKLPSKDAIKANKDAMKSKLDGKAGLFFFFV